MTLVSQTRERVRVRVHSGLTISSTEGHKLSAGVAARCAVGEIITVQDSTDAVSNDRVVWIHGGTRHDPARLELDESAGCCYIDAPACAVHQIPESVSDSVALLANEMAAAIHVAKIVTARQLTTIAIVATSSVAPLAYLLLWCFQQASDRQQNRRVMIKWLDDVSEAEGNSSRLLSSAPAVHSGTDGGDALDLDCCVDLCCIDTSLDFATRELEPLGTLLLLTPDPPADALNRSTAINMNAVVVNELSLISIGDFQAALSEAVEVLTTHAVEHMGVAQLLADSGRVLSI